MGTVSTAMPRASEGVKPAGFGKSKKDKEFTKKVQKWGTWALGAAVIAAIFAYAEYEKSIDNDWAANYDHKCEVCQTIVTSGILTRSMIFQQAQKEMKEQRQATLDANPDVELPPEEEPKVPASRVLGHMCHEQQIESMLANNRFTVANGYSTVEDPDFGASLKKLCWFAMSNSSTTRVFKRMLEMPGKPIKKPTLVSLSLQHFQPVCVEATGMCSAEELEQGTMVDPQA